MVHEASIVIITTAIKIFESLFFIVFFAQLFSIGRVGVIDSYSVCFSIFLENGYSSDGS